MKKSVLSISVLLCLGGLMTGCSNASIFNVKNEKPSIEELENKIKEQEEYINELEQYKQEQEHINQQAISTQRSYDYEQEQLNEEKYYMALTEVYIISKINDDDTIYSDIEYGESSNFTVLSDDINELGNRVPWDYRITMCFKYIKSGETFKLSGNDIANYQIIGEYEEIIINTEK